MKSVIERFSVVAQTDPIAYACVTGYDYGRFTLDEALIQCIEAMAACNAAIRELLICNTREGCTVSGRTSTESATGGGD